MKNIIPKLRLLMENSKDISMLMLKKLKISTNYLMKEKLKEKKYLINKIKIND